MNETIRTILKRGSLRRYSEKEISKEEYIKGMFKDRDRLFVCENKYNAKNYAQYHYNMKVKSDFSKEMTRSVKVALDDWSGKIL